MGGRGGGPNISALGQALKKAAAAPAAPASPGTQPEERIIRDIYDSLNQPIFNRAGVNQGNLDLVYVSDIRQRLATLGWDRGKQDAALLKLATSRRAVFTPQANQKVLTQAQRDGALRMGNQDRHLITMKES